ncbi:diguanylate cyclase [Bacillus pinisoli]|uniref:diguanylate cyclase n=1 Tax=Bacillus pinisoli TaxID=2901866 RepID=UPI001FF140FD|nr:diguanylate cyclase [Bacillus pinisoli]
MLKKLSLQKKIIFMFTLVIVVTMSSIVLFNSYTLYNAVRETNVNQLKGITTAINGRYEEARSIKDVQQIFDYIKHRQDNVLALNLHMEVKDRYEVVASTDRNDLERSTPEILSPTYLSGKTMVAHVNDQGVKKVRIVAPLITDGETSGAIELILDSTEELEAANKKIILTILVAGAVSIVLLVFLSFIIRRLLVQPLLTLREAAVSIQKGETYQPVEVNASPEIREVANAFNEMVYNLEDRLQKSITDPLTGLYNSAYFKRMLNLGMKECKENGHSMALLFCDIDNFKKLNDHQGHLYGDKILTEISELISHNVRAGDIVCRYGGEEFVVIMKNADETTAGYVAERIREKVAIHGSMNILTPITISIGLAIYPDDTSEDEFVHIADQAMYAAKSLGKNRVITARQLKTMEKQEYERKVEEQKSLLHTILSIVKAVEVKDPYTTSHSEVVSEYAAKLASRMGIGEKEIHDIAVAGLLHDVGKIGIPLEILNKEGQLDEEEYDTIKTHPILGYHILSNIEEVHQSLPFILHHHEQPDGEGYPHGLKGTEIPLGASIIAVVAAYHSMTSKRPYRKEPLTEEAAIQELLNGKSKQFNSDVVDEFLLMLEEIRK